MAFCPNCGREHAGDGRFCGGCGTSLDISGTDPLGPSGTTSQIDPSRSPVSETDQGQMASMAGSFYGLTRKNIWLMLLLTIITAGIYMPYWYLTRHQIFNALSSPAKFTQAPIVIWLIWFIVDAVFIVVSISKPQSELAQSLEPIETILNLAAAIFGLWLVFRAKRILLEHLAVIGRNGTTISGILTFIFGFLYIQHKINQLVPETSGLRF